MNRFLTLLLAASCLTAVSLRSTAQSLDEPHTFYQSDFSQNDFDGWSTTQTIEYDNRILLGNFSNETCSLTLSCLPAHTSLQLTFDVYALDTWDGNGSTGGPNDPDLWFTSIDGNTLIETTFGHAFGVPQSYPANYPAHNDPFSGATQQCLETFCYGQNCASAQYSMSFTIEHSLSNAEIIFGADLLQDICDESWALGDVAVSLIGFVETPVAMGCTDSLACNFSEESTCDDGSCHFNCQFCHEGTVWDEDLFKCVVANPADINFDGCVQLNDLLDLLSAYGDCGAEEEASGFALSFDGVNDHVDFGNASLGNVEDVTFDVLMKTGSDSEGLGSNYQALLSKDCNGCEFSTGDWAILIGHNGNGVASFTINNSSGVAAVESGALNDEEWHWISVTRNATTGLVHLYVDGVEVDSDIGPVGLVHNEEKMYLAKYFLTSPSHYEGLIGEFRVWNRELTGIEIGTYLGAELQGNESGLVGLWNFSEGEGDVLTDQTNGGLNGQIIEATWTPTTETP